MKGGLEAMRAASDLRGDFEEIRLVGGGSRSALWRRIIADALQMRVACPAAPETAALGAALQAAAMVAGAADIGAWIAADHDAPLEASVEPDGSAADAYDAAFELYVARGRALFVPQ